MNDEIRKRFTAYKVSLGLLANGNIEFEQEKFSKIVVSNKEISRVNIIATVVDKYVSREKSYISITIDDGTGYITARAFSDSIEMLKNIEIGDTITVIGLLRYFNNELYITPEIIKSIDAKWLLVRKLELTKEYGKLYENSQKKEEFKEQTNIQQNEFKNNSAEKIETDESENVETEIIEIPQSVRNMILEFIEKNENGDGINVDKLIMSLNSDVEEIKREIIELLEEGTIYEPKPGNLRIL